MDILNSLNSYYDKVFWAIFNIDPNSVEGLTLMLAITCICPVICNMCRMYLDRIDRKRKHQDQPEQINAPLLSLMQIILLAIIVDCFIIVLPVIWDH